VTGSPAEVQPGPTASPPERAPLTALVFAGGAARRLGGEKCGRQFEGRPLLLRVLDVAREVADEVLLLPGARDVPEAADLVRVPDWPDVPGPLGALGAGLEAARHDWCLALPCDMPRLRRDVLERLARRAAGGPAPAALVVAGPSGREPFCALYHRGLLPALARHAAAGGRSLQGWLEACAAAGRLTEVPGQALTDLDPELTFLHNVNTPADLLPAAPQRDARATP